MNEHPPVWPREDLGVSAAVEDAAHLSEALHKLRLYARPAAIVLDLMMPGMNRWQFRDAQRDDPELADIPVIVASAQGRDDKIQADIYVTKPFSLETLFRAVSRYAT